MQTTHLDHRSGSPSPRPRSDETRALLLATLLIVVALASIGCGAGSREDQLEEIRGAQAENQFEGTIEPLRRLLEAEPDDPELNYLYGRALAQSGRGNIAHWSLRKAMSDEEWVVPAGLQLSFLSLSGRDFNEVVEITDVVLEQEPENVQALLMRANAYAHWKKDPELALETADRVLEIEPNALEAYEPRILALLELDRLPEAKASLAAAGQIAREVGATEAVLAWHCSTSAAFSEEAGELEEARAKWLECLEVYPAHMEVVANAVAFYDGHGEPARALEVLEAAHDAAPDSRVIRVSLSDRLRHDGRVADAEALLRAATQTEDPRLAADAWLDLGNLRLVLGEHAAAAEALGRAVEAANEVGQPDAGLLFQYAEALLVAGQFERAREVGESLPVPPHRQLILARIAQEQRDPARAMKEFDEALRLWPDNAFARYYAALAAEELGDFDRALEEYRYSIRISPGATDARVRSAELLIARGQLGSGAQILHSSYASTPLDLDGELLGLEISGILGDTNAVAEKLEIVRARWPGWAGVALAEAASGVAKRGGPTMAASMLAGAPGVDFANPIYTPALRALVEYTRAAGRSETLQAVLDETFATRPDDGQIQEVRAFDLELAGAPAAEVKQAYERALELQPEQPLALAGLGRVAQAEGNVELALGYFDRAAAADPSDPVPILEAARARISLGRVEEAAERLDALLVLHPLDAAAAAERARIDLSEGTVTQRTLDRARRAAQFGRSPEDWELLSDVQASLGDTAGSERAAERALRLRER